MSSSAASSSAPAAPVRRRRPRRVGRRSSSDDARAIGASGPREGHMSASTAPTAAADLQAIVFGLGDERYGIEIGFVHEIIRNQELTVVPGASPAVLGLINLRSQVLPVLSLRTIFGRPSIEPGPAA